jgi:hypothetical protein
MVIVDWSTLPQEENRVKMLGRENWAKLKHPFVADALVAEIVRVVGVDTTHERTFDFDS